MGKKIRICWKHFDPKNDFASQVDLDNWEDCNGAGFGHLKRGTISSNDMPQLLDDLTLGASITLDHSTPSDSEKIVKNLEKLGL